MPMMKMMTTTKPLPCVVSASTGRRQTKLKSHRERAVWSLPTSSPSSQSKRLIVRRRSTPEETESRSKMAPADVGSSLTTFVAETKLPTDRGFYRVRAYRHTNPVSGEVTEPVCVVYGDVGGREDVPVRVHDACFTSEVLGSLKCDCKQQLELAMEYIKENGPGIVCYLQQEGRGIGLANKIAAYAVQEGGVDTVDANRQLGLPDDTREYTAVENMLRELDVRSVQLMTNNPRKIRELECGGLKITGRIRVRGQGEFIQRRILGGEGASDVARASIRVGRYWDAKGNTVYDSLDEMEGDYRRRDVR